MERDEVKFLDEEVQMLRRHAVTMHMAIQGGPTPRLLDLILSALMTGYQLGKKSTQVKALHDLFDKESLR